MRIKQVLNNSFSDHVNSEPFFYLDIDVSPILIGDYQIKPMWGTRELPMFVHRRPTTD
jgi:hypothetical protein